MSHHGFDPERDRFGSATFASEHEIASTGLFDDGPDTLFLGFCGNRRLLYSGQGGLLLTAGARSGKLRDVLAYNVCQGIFDGTALILDMKGELAAISQNQTGARKHNIYWNPRGLHRLKSDRINPVSYIHKDSPSLVSDVKVFARNMIGRTGAPGAVYFENRARDYLEAVILTLVQIDDVLTLPRLYEVLNLIPGCGNEWLDFAFEMAESGIELCRSVEEEIASARKSEGGGFRGIMGELLSAFSALSDPVLMASVSPPYTFSLDKLCDSNARYHLYMMPPAEFISAWAPIIKAILVGAQIYKARQPSAPMQTWFLDECAQLKNFPLVVDLFSIGAGQGIRPWAVMQSGSQMKAIGPDAETIITSSAAVRQYFAVRDYRSAQTVSQMLGAQTLDYDDELQQGRAALAKRQAIQAAMFGADPLAEGMKLRHHASAAQHRARQQRPLRTPDEVLNMPSDQQFIFADGLSGAILAQRRPYYDQAFMAGNYHPNPYYPPADSVRIRTRFGHTTRRIITEPIPPEFAHYPQYSEGCWSYVEGFR